MNKQTIAAIHAVVVVLACTSPLWLDWRLVAFGAAIYWLQILVFKACVLTIAEFETADKTFVGHYLGQLLSHFGLTLNQSKTKFVLDWLLPPLLTLTAYLVQI